MQACCMAQKRDRRFGRCASSGDQLGLRGLSGSSGLSGVRVPDPHPTPTLIRTLTLTLTRIKMTLTLTLTLTLTAKLLSPLTLTQLPLILPLILATIN